MIRSVSHAVRAGALAVVLGLAALLQLSCATGGYAPQGASMPAARAGLRPEFRVFYDELKEYGDWILIEPYGFVFRPREDPSTWSPYWDGFWSPSDPYGWVWVSSEPFGWATYHYGRWVDDDYQSWVWVPGLDWAPAWVSWAGNDQYVGWAPLAPGNGYGTGDWGNNFHFVARRDLAATDLQSRTVSPERSAQILRQSDPIRNTAEIDHVLVNRGPRIDWIEQAAGPLKRVKIEDVPTLGSGGLKGAEARPSGESRREPAMGGSLRPRQDLKQAAESDAQRVKTIIQQKQAQPAVIKRLKPGLRPAETTQAPADSAR